MNNLVQSLKVKKSLLPFCIFVCTIILIIPVKAQEQPPKPITVTTVEVIQFLNFGAIIPTGDGTVTIDAAGLRSKFGGIIFPFIGPSPTRALFRVHALKGTLITILNGPDAILTGNAKTITMKIGDASTGSPFITSTQDITDVYIGGTLTVKDILINPAGEYSGQFSVTFIQQ